MLPYHFGLSQTLEPEPREGRRRFPSFESGRRRVPNADASCRAASTLFFQVILALSLSVLGSCVVFGPSWVSTPGLCTTNASTDDGNNRCIPPCRSSLWPALVGADVQENPEC